MPGNEPVGAKDYRNLDLLESAAARPFQSAFGEDVHGTIYRKGAALFHSLVCNHSFSNGNKRTALLALDMFLIANGLVLALSNENAYNLTKRTASHNEDGRLPEDILSEIEKLLEDFSVPIDALVAEQSKDNLNIQMLHEYCVKERDSIINHRYNQPQPD